MTMAEMARKIESLEKRVKILEDREVEPAPSTKFSFTLSRIGLCGQPPIMAQEYRVPSCHHGFNWC